LAIAWREIEERWTWLGLTALLAVAPLAGPLVGIRDHELQGTVALLLFTLLCALSTMVFGVSVMAGDLNHGRLGFLLARPVSWPTIWAGKLLAALLLSGVSLLVFVPALIAAWGLLPLVRASLDAVGAVAFLSWIAIGVALSQAAAIALRSRSRWLVFDLAGLVVTADFGMHVLLRLGISGALRDDAGGLAIVVGAVALALVAATAAPFAAGGVSPGRAHAAQAVTLWGSLGALLLVGWLVSEWAAHPRATDFRNIRTGVADTRGRWIALVGQGRGLAVARPALFFARDTASTPALVGSTFMEPWTLAVSDDGGTAAWVEGTSANRLDSFDWFDEHVYFARAADPVRAVRLDLALPLQAEGNTLALSPTGDRLVVSTPDFLYVFELTTRRAVAHVAMPRALFDRRAAFLDDDVVVVYGSRSRGGNIDIVCASLSSARADVTGHMDAANALVLGTQGRMLAVEFSARRARLHDMASGKLLATLADDASSSAPEGVFTADGHVALLAMSGGHARLRLFTGAGDEAGRIDLGPTGGGSRLDVDSSGRLLAGLFRSAKMRETVVIDPVSLAVVRHVTGFVPLRAGHDPRLRSPRQTGGDGNDLFIDAQNRIVRLDSDTGTSTVAIGPRG
jgi:hypothetical protein